MDSDSSKKSITWGPFDEQMTVELTFYHKTGVGASWDISAIKADKMKEVRIPSIFLVRRLGINFTALVPGRRLEDGGHFGMHSFYSDFEMIGPKFTMNGMEF